MHGRSGTDHYIRMREDPTVIVRQTQPLNLFKPLMKLLPAFQRSCSCSLVCIQIHVVYFVWSQSEGIHSNNYETIIRRNLGALLGNGLYSEQYPQYKCQLYPVVSATSETKRKYIMDHLRSVLGKDISIKFTEADGTGYEWPGINKVWQLGQTQREEGHHPLFPRQGRHPR